MRIRYKNIGTLIYGILNIALTELSKSMNTMKIRDCAAKEKRILNHVVEEFTILSHLRACI